MAGGDPVRGPGSLYGRGSECSLLDDVLAALRAGESRTLLIHGEAGIGKTALLDYAVASAADLRVLHAAGVESEMELRVRVLAPAVCAAARQPWSNSLRRSAAHSRSRSAGPQGRRRIDSSSGWRS